MANAPLQIVINQLRRVVGQKSASPLTDAQLLQAFVTQGDQTSFEVLVWRHGTMVLSLCHRLLRDAHEAEDAFQATFLVFARKAGSIGKGEALGSWLSKVAYRIALRFRTKMARSENREEIEEIPAREDDELFWRDLRPVLDEEIDRLPEKYRAPVVLCYLEGHTNEEAAEQLGCPKGTILSRLAHARQCLRSRLSRRGLALSLSSAGLVTILSAKSASATVPLALVSSTTEAAVAFAAGKVLPGLVSASVATLTKGVLHTMFLTKLKLCLGVLLVLTVLGSGTSLVIHEALADRPAPSREKADTPREGKRAPEVGRTEDRELAVAGKVVAVDKDGKQITLEVSPENRGEEPKKTEITIGDKTTVIYNGVGPNQTKPTEGYLAFVRLAEKGKPLAANVTFQGTASFRGLPPNYTARLASVASDGKTVTLEMRPAKRGDEPQKLDIKINDKTSVIFHNVGRDGAKLAEGLLVQVWLEEDSKDLARTLELAGNEIVERRGSPPEMTGTIVAVAKDGKSVTLETRPQGRGEEAKKMEIKINDKTAVAFRNVVLNQAKLTEGFQARVWLEEGSKDTAATLSILGVVKERDPLMAGRVAAVSSDGKSITLEQPPQARGEEPKRTEIKITDKTRIAFSGVAAGEAKPTEGYFAQVSIKEGTKDVARVIHFGKRGAERRER